MFQRQLSFGEAVKRALTVNYFNFSGRASRSEFWWFCLFTAIIGYAVSLIMKAMGVSDDSLLIVSGIINLVFLLPSLGLGVRRLHDISKSGWWYFLAFVPLVGAIILLIWFAKPSVPAPNQYGPVPNVE